MSYRVIFIFQPHCSPNIHAERYIRTLLMCSNICAMYNKVLITRNHRVQENSC